ncbi:efflux RND transporter periplasmic adaptor subunit [Pelomicrobium methylotrophicum]|uniref:efflux RND transporter periplasmic adaptor subunit n=1 Tax=Pelomicrobium methylotrophicum TaxID=2602750 RepID=UPI001969A773|nr:efflux RND transporter periplasmic adaptor subunit [Pelomicrobium methylotrophicum]
MTRCALLLLPLLLTACGPDGKGGSTGFNGGSGPPPEVEVIQVSRTAVTLTPELPGRVAAVRTAQVRARVEGIVEKRLFTEGSEVKEGQPLFRLDDRTYRAAALGAEADVEVKKINLARLESLLPLQAVSQQEVDAARAALKLAEAQLARARLDLENTTVPAPISGYIGRALVTEGALVGRGEATLLATIEQLHPVHVLFTQPNADVLRLKEALAAGRLKPADTRNVELILENGKPYPHKGRLLMSELAVDPSTGSITLKAEFPNPERLLLPGTFVRVRLPQAVAPGVIAVPQKAVLAGPQGQFVLLVGPENKAVPQPVKVGPMAGDRFVIEEGLVGGETLIVSGVQKVRFGTVVKPVLSRQAG